MARTNLPITTAVPNNGILYPAGTAIDATNGMNVQFPTSAIPAASSVQDLFLIVNNTAATAKNVIVRAGSNPPAYRSGLGDLTVAVTNATTQILGPFESARFVQADGSLNVDFQAATTGTIIALLKPSRF